MHSRRPSPADVTVPLVPDVPAGDARIATLVVIGVGLIGGSFALALRAAGRVGRVVGIGRGRTNLDARSSSASSIARSRSMKTDSRARRGGPRADRHAGREFSALSEQSKASSPPCDRHRCGQHQSQRDRRRRAGLRGTSRFVPGHPIAGTEHTGATPRLRPCSATATSC
jgi:prephenate dehydrogenase